MSLCRMSSGAPLCCLLLGIALGVACTSSCPAVDRTHRKVVFICPRRYLVAELAGMNIKASLMTQQ